MQLKDRSTSEGVASQPPTTVSSARPSLQAGQRLLDQIALETPYLQIPDSNESVPLFLAINAPASMAAELGFGVATPRQFIDMTNEEFFDASNRQYVVEIKDESGVKSADAFFKVEPSTADDSRGMKLQWSWKQAPSENLATELKLGAFVIWWRSKPTLFKAIPLHRPDEGAAINLLASLLDGITFSPHSAAELAAPQIAERLEWAANVTDFANSSTGLESESKSELWLAPRSTNNSSNLFRLNPTAMETRLSALLGQQNLNNEDMANTISKLIEHASPIQAEIRIDMPAMVHPDSPEMFSSARVVLFMKSTDGSRNSLIVQYNPRAATKPKLKEFEELTKVAIANWLVANLVLPVDSHELISSGDSDGFDQVLFETLESQGDRIKAVFSRVLFDAFVDLLKRDYAFEVIRTTKLHSKQGNHGVEIPAYIGR